MPVIGDNSYLNRARSTLGSVRAMMVRAGEPADMRLVARWMLDEATRLFNEADLADDDEVYFAGRSIHGGKTSSKEFSNAG